MSVMMIGAAGIVVLVTILFYLLKIGSREVGLPPGPPTFPFVGNLHQLPKGGAWLRQFIEWSREYGGIISLKITSKPIVVLSSPRLVRDFLDRRSASTSDRPVMKLADMITGGMNLTLARNGPIWRSQRRALHSLLNRQSL
ncbi:hypothetical protein QCA50_015161 [Cerrena zonata]|uniref:Cytochrome P450 n=1 Tax=Cerrena zonata TaxID=2478898 RepID=A0AAW0FRY0_9APHY